MQRAAGHAELVQEQAQPHRGVGVLHEDERFTPTHAQSEQGHARQELVFGPHVQHAVRDVGTAVLLFVVAGAGAAEDLGSRGHVQPHRVLQHERLQPGELLARGCGEEHALHAFLAGVHHLLDVLLVPKAQQQIRLVEHQQLQPGGQRAAREEVLADALRGARGRRDEDLGRRARELTEHGGGALRRGELARAQGRRALPEEERRFLLHLMRELARGHEHERARVGGRRASHRGVAAGDNLVDRGEQIRRGLAAPGVRASHHVLALQHERDRLGLHRRRRAVPLLRQRAEQPRVQPEGHPAVACVARLGTHRRRREGVERGRGCTSAESGALSQWAAAAKHINRRRLRFRAKRAAAMRRPASDSRNAS